ncbi:MAG TPA: PAS domain S-box protein [Pseudolabrys sp.]|nr:PAS domain S-box protein [Pseudolabrys sp.]
MRHGGDETADQLSVASKSAAEMRGRIAVFDWASTPLGARTAWPASLKMVVDLILASGFPMAVRWGPECITLYNDAYALVLGNRHPRALGRPTREVWPETWHDLGPLTESILRGERPGFFAEDHPWLIRRHGMPEEARFTISYSPIAQASAPNGIGGVLVTAFETTARVRNEAMLRHLTDRLESEVAQRTRERDRIWQVSQDLLGVSDFDGYMLSINPAWTTLLGWSEAELKSMHVNRLRHPDDVAVSEACRAQLAGGQQTARLESRLRHRDGSWCWIDWTMTVDDGLIYLSGRHVTQEKVSDEALRASEQQFRSLVAGVTDYAIFMLNPNGIISSWNAGAERIKGYRASEIIGRHFSEFYTEEDRALKVPHRALAIAAGTGKFEAEGRRVRKDGSIFWANVVIDAIHDEAGALIGFAKITRDVTERREAQAALERTQQQLAQAQKLEALGQLTGGVAHDFNNLLMVVSGQAQTLLRRISDAKHVRSLEAIQAAAARGENLTRQLLTFGRRQPLNPRSVDPAMTIGAFHDVLASSTGGHADLRIDMPSHVWPISIDISEFELALVNLVVNARDAMPKGGVITVSATNRSLTGAETPERLEGDYVALSVADTGTGIAPEILGKIFEPFFTTKGPTKGTGLGLSQAYGFARQSGGLLSVASEVGRGTIVTMYLPRSHVPVAPTVPQPSTAGHKGHGETLLVVEDNSDVQAVAITLLEQLNYRTVAVDSARGALDLLASGKTFDLLFTDVMLPGELDGVQLAEAVRRDYPNLPVLLTSGYARALNRQHGFQILRKPYQMSALAEATRAALARS